MLQSLEQTLDVIAIAVASEVASRRLSTVCLRRDDRQDAAPKRVLSDGVPSSFVGEQGIRFDHGHVEQRGAAGKLTSRGLSGRGQRERP